MPILAALLLVLTFRFVERFEVRYSVPRVIRRLNIAFREDQTAFVFAGEGGRLWIALNMTPATKWIHVIPLARPDFYPELIRQIIKSLREKPPHCVLMELDLGPYYGSRPGYQKMRAELQQYLHDSSYYRSEALSTPNYDVYVKKSLLLSANETSALHMEHSLTAA